MELVDLAATPQGQSDFVRYLAQVCDHTGVEYASYAAASPVSGKVFAFTTYPDRWKQHYMQQELHLTDPTLHTAARSIAPVDWSRLERTESFNSVFDQAHDFGIPDVGLTIPIRGPYGETGLFSVTSSTTTEDWSKLRKKIIANLQLAAVYMHDRVMKSDRLIDLLRYPALSTREIEMLQWVAAGKTQQDIGDILSMSPRTVEVHLRSSREKLNALSTAQAVGRAISMGLISPS
jgi:DNA-binding CsgD family transcriptional regulator